MSQAEGINAQLACQIETTYGKIPTSIDMKKLFHISGSPKMSRNLFSSKVLTSSRNPKKPGRGRVNVTASIPTEISPQMGTIFRGAFGSVVTTGAGPYVHTIKIGTLPSLLMELGYTDLVQYLLYLGMKINKLTFPKITDEGIQMMTIDLVGQCEAEALAFDAETAGFNDGATLTGGTSSHTGLILSVLDEGTTGKIALYNHTGNFQDNEAITDDGGTPGAAVADITLGKTPLDATIQDPGHTAFDGFSIADIKEGGSVIAIINSIDNLAIENNLDTSDKNFVIGGGGRRRSLPQGTVKVSGTVNALFEDMDLYHKAVRHTESSLELTFKHGTGAGTAGNEQLKVTVPELIYAPNSPEVPGPEGLLVSLPFEAYYDDDAAASAMWLELTNMEATI